MDRKAFINNLKLAFSNSKMQARYSEAWLSNIDFGGLYYTDKYYILNVKTKNKINSFSEEISVVINFLNENFKEELNHIMSVDIHNSENGFYGMGKDLLVYSED